MLIDAGYGPFIYLLLNPFGFIKFEFKTGPGSNVTEIYLPADRHRIPLRHLVKPIIIRGVHV